MKAEADLRRWKSPLKSLRANAIANFPPRDFRRRARQRQRKLDGCGRLERSQAKQRQVHSAQLSRFDRIFRRLVTAMVEEAGGGMDDIVKVTVFIRDMRLYDEIHEVRRRYFEEPYPASSMVEVSALIDPRLLIEIEAVAVIG